MRVLILEDDAALGSFLRKGLEREGHIVSVEADGIHGLEQVLREAPDLLLLDLSLPGMDGIQLLRGMQGQCSQTFVLVLSGRVGVQNRVECLDLGADDFLQKPFSLLELIARCKALSRRHGRQADSTLRVGGMELNLLTRCAQRDGQAVELTGKEFALLEYLMRSGGRTVTRAELLREVWQISPDAGTNVVDVCVNYLRKKLSLPTAGDGGVLRTGLAIETVRGEGYALGATSCRKPVRKQGCELLPGELQPGLMGGLFASA